MLEVAHEAISWYRMANNQAGTTYDLAARFAFSEMNETSFRRRSTADFPCLVAIQDQI